MLLRPIPFPLKSLNPVCNKIFHPVTLSGAALFRISEAHFYTLWKSQFPKTQTVLEELYKI